MILFSIILTLFLLNHFTHHIYRKNIHSNNFIFSACLVFFANDFQAIATARPSRCRTGFI